MKDSIKKFISRVLYPTGSTRTVIRGPTKGLKFVASDSMRIRYALMSNACDEAFLATKITTGDVVFDVGANRGQLALLFAQEVGSSGKVMAFEPMEENLELLRQNIKLNGFDNVQIINAAAASEEGTMSFKFAGAMSAMVGRDQEVFGTEREGDPKTVRSVPLDKIADRYGIWPTFVKIDVEGSADGVLAGASRILDRGPDIYIEVHSSREKRAVEEEVLGRGYFAWSITGQESNGEKINNTVPDGVRHLWCTK